MLKRLRPDTSDDGFTLIELVVVFIILGILATIAFPIYKDYQHKGYSAQGQSLAKHFAPALEEYVAPGESMPGSGGLNFTRTLTGPALAAAAFPDPGDYVYSLIGFDADRATPADLEAVDGKLAHSLKNFGIITPDGRWLFDQYGGGDIDVYVTFYAKAHGSNCTGVAGAGESAACNFAGYEICTIDNRMMHLSDYDLNGNGHPDFLDGSATGIVADALQARWNQEASKATNVYASWRGGLSKQNNCIGHLARQSG